MDVPGSSSTTVLIEDLVNGAEYTVKNGAYTTYPRVYIFGLIGV